MKIKSRAADERKSAKKQENALEQPTFTFSWETNKKKTVQSQVFKKKTPKVRAKTTEENVEAQNKVAVMPQIVEESSNHNAHIKRKKRKDKLLAKQLMKEGIETDTIRTGNDKHKKNYSLFTGEHKSMYVSQSSGKAVSEKVFANSGNNFSDLKIHKHLVSNLEKIDFKTLTNVQEKAIPIVMSGKNCLIRSQTGSGKTLVYAVPIVNALQSLEPRIKRTDGVQALIVVPTRELALQTHELFNKINTFQWIVAGHLCGGENRKTEKERLRKGVSILIGTPGRLLDHALHTSCFNLSKIRWLVLDEADQLLDMGFRKDIISLVEHIDQAASNSEYDPMAIIRNQTAKSQEKSDCFTAEDVESNQRQTILLSATLSKQVSELADFTMKNHTYIDALDEDSSNAGAESDNFIIPDTVRQEFVLTYVKHRLFTLAALIIAKCKQNSKLFVFMASKNMVEFHYDLFTKYLRRMPKNRSTISKNSNYKGDRVVEFDEDLEDVIEEDQEEDTIVDTEFFMLHGSMDQKIRKEVFTGFRKAKKGVLLCTDVAARGLDVPEADCIIQYTPPQSDKDYLHRVGRTGRAGKHGSAIIFLTYEEQEYIPHLEGLKVFLKKTNQDAYLRHLCELMSQSNVEEAATSLQRYFEACVTKDKDLHKSACFAYSSWSRFYNSYSTNLRRIFDFKRVNLGHYVTSFALTITPSEVAKIVRGQVANVEKPRLNKKLATHDDEINPPQQQPTSKNKKRKPINTVSEYSSGLEPLKKKKVHPTTRPLNNKLSHLKWILFLTLSSQVHLQSSNPKLLLRRST